MGGQGRGVERRVGQVERRVGQVRKAEGWVERVVGQGDDHCRLSGSERSVPAWLGLVGLVYDLREFAVVWMTNLRRPTN